MASSTFFIPSVNVIGADSLTDAMNMMADYGIGTPYWYEWEVGLVKCLEMALVKLSKESNGKIDLEKLAELEGYKDEEAIIVGDKDEVKYLVKKLILEKIIIIYKNIIPITYKLGGKNIWSEKTKV